MHSYHIHTIKCMFLYCLFIVSLFACMWCVRVEEYVAPDQQFFDLQGQSFEGQLEQPPELAEQPVSQDQGKCP